jgi:oligopeptide transport system substrate-binding protein
LNFSRRSVFPPLVALVALALPACSRRAPPEPPSLRAPPQVLRLSQRNEPDDLDPALASLPDDFFVIRALSEGLVLPAPPGVVPAPGAADHWEASADGLTWSFHLRPDARWTNGEPVTADDFVASYRRALTPATAAPKANLFFVVKNARAYATGQVTDFSTVGFLAPDPHTLLVVLERPTPQFLAYAASGPWIPVNPRVVESLGRQWTRPGNYVGNGPFVLTEWRPQQRIVVRANPHYHGAAGVQLDEIQFIHFDDTNAEDRAYRDGQIDVTMSVPIDKLAVYARDRPAELKRTPLAETRYLAFNVTRPPLNDVRVRLALSDALDRTRLTRDVLQGGQEPAYRMLPPGLRLPGDIPADLVQNLFTESTTETHPDREQTRATDAEEARRLLAAAGFPGGHGFPHLEISGWVIAPPLLEAIQAMWKKELGIDVVLNVREARVHAAALRAGQYDIGFITLIPDVADPLSALERFVTGAPENYPHWHDAIYDRRVHDARQSTDPSRQAAALRATEVRLLQQAPVAPVYFNAKNWMIRPEVKGWQEDALWSRNYLGVYLERPIR